MSDDGDSSLRLRVVPTTALTLEQALEQILELQNQLAEETEARHRAEEEASRATTERDAALLVKIQADERARKAEAQKTKAEQHLQRAEEVAGIDPLTGIHNRRGLDRLVQNILRRIKGPEKRDERRQGYREDVLSILLLDIDRFKRINDTYGHDAGDEVLRQAAAYLRTLARVEEGRDVISRYGGEEILIVYDGYSAAEVIARLKQDAGGFRHIGFLAKFAGLHGQPAEEMITFTGVATDWLHKTEPLKDAVTRADLLLIQMKHEDKRNRVIKVTAPRGKE